MTFARQSALRAAAFTAIAFGAFAHVHAPAALSQAPDSQAPDDALPILYDPLVLREVTFTLAAADWTALRSCTRMSVDGVDRPADMEVDGERLAQVGIRCKGNSSLGINSSKKPFNVTTDAFVKGQDLWGFDVINFNNNWSDPSLLREAIMLTAIAPYAPVPRFAFARVTANGEYLGVYLMVEQVKAEWVDHWFDGDGGTVIRGDSPTDIRFDSSPLVWWGEDLARYKAGYEVKGRAAASDEGYTALREMIRALDAPEAEGGFGAADYEAGIWGALNVDSALWYLASINIMAHYDSYYVGKNYYLYLGESDSRFNVINWDMGLGFGTFGWPGESGMPGPGVGGFDPALVDPFGQEALATRPLIRRLLAVPTYRADYLAHYRTLLQTVFTSDWMLEVGQTYQDLISEAARDEVAAQGSIGGSFTHDQFLRNLRETVTLSGGGGRPGPGAPFRSAPGILSLVEDRIEYLNERDDLIAPDLRLAEHTLLPESPTAADDVRISARFEGADGVSSVEVRYRVRGGTEIRLPMTPDGAGGWTAEIPAQRQGRTVGYAFRVGLDDGRSEFFPKSNWLRPYSYKVAGVALPLAGPGDLVINEFMADNDSTLADEFGEFDDWVELYNRGSAPIALGGLYLSDEPADPWAYALPDLTLAPGEYLLIWCDNDPEQGELHAPFRLNNAGESVSLASRDAVLDLVVFDRQEVDVSWARSVDGGPEWQACHAPSPGGPNACGEAPPPTPTAEPSPTAEPTSIASPTREPAPSATPDGPRGNVYLPSVFR